MTNPETSQELTVGQKIFDWTVAAENFIEKSGIQNRVYFQRSIEKARMYCFDEPEIAACIVRMYDACKEGGVEPNIPQLSCVTLLTARLTPVKIT
jgi:hypothetical protein